MTEGGSVMVEVRLLDLPVPLWARAQEHTDELLREFTLLAEGMRHETEAHDPLPVQLVQLVEELTKTYSGFSGEQEAELFASAARGDETIDIAYTIPRAVEEAAVRLAAALDEADDFCRRGDHLLTLATPVELVRFRRWFLSEFIGQASGKAPVPWPGYTG